MPTANSIVPFCRSPLQVLELPEDSALEDWLSLITEMIRLAPDEPEGEEARWWLILYALKRCIEGYLNEAHNKEFWVLAVEKIASEVVVSAARDAVKMPQRIKGIEEMALRNAVFNGIELFAEEEDILINWGLET